MTSDVVALSPGEDRLELEMEKVLERTDETCGIPAGSLMTQDPTGTLEGLHHLISLSANQDLEELWDSKQRSLERGSQQAQPAF